MLKPPSFVVVDRAASVLLALMVALSSPLTVTAPPAVTAPCDVPV